MLFLSDGIAQDKKDLNQKTDFTSASLITRYENETTEYKFLSMVELNEEVEQIIQDLDFNNFNSEQKNCIITIEIKVEVTIGDIKGLVSGSIISRCEDAAAATKKLKAMLLAAAMG